MDIFQIDPCELHTHIGESWTTLEVRFARIAARMRVGHDVDGIVILLATIGSIAQHVGETDMVASLVDGLLVHGGQAGCVITHGANGRCADSAHERAGFGHVML